MISVIIPVYNTQEYLPALFDAIDRQTIRNFEVIFVDDGTKDNSNKLLDDFKAACTRTHNDFPLTIIHKENEGVSKARNAGLEAAKGDYVVFIDSDDLISPSYLEGLFYAISRDDCDLGCVASRYTFRPDKKLKKQSISEKKYLCMDDCKGYGDYLLRLWQGSGVTQLPTPCFVWNKIYRRNLIGSLRFESGLPAEDIKFNSEYIRKCKKIGFLKQKLYNYLQHRNSLSKQFEKYASFVKRTIAEYNDVLNCIEDKQSDNYSKAAAYFFCGLEAFYIVFIKCRLFKSDPLLYGEFKSFFDANYIHFKKTKVPQKWIFKTFRIIYRLTSVILGRKTIRAV